MNATETVKNSFIFNTLNDEQLAKVVNITRERRFDKGSVIMHEGHEGDAMYMIAKGEVEVSKSLTMKFGDDDYRQKEKVLSRFRPEDHVVFGEMALIAKGTRSASITARTDCVLLEITRDDFLKLIKEEPDMGVTILLKISELLIDRLKHSDQDVIRLTTALSIALSG
ncbi:MAG: cyclic nucleotide-binding domain-containing protein [Deltaproteobacteria bacterium]|nr:cyclic nucleotide-binding domain-containing protein [Deltaproteobacteria bacterium]MCD6137888.1 cyclic nucleotide-binding domain-containing protein [Deltaproteobacteria bacterium]RLC10545.1 MAG: hypothetical protein DRH43_06075 [Deltaproteobacteria bacterium]